MLKAFLYLMGNLNFHYIIYLYIFYLLNIVYHLDKNHFLLEQFYNLIMFIKLFKCNFQFNLNMFHLLHKLFLLYISYLYYITFICFQQLSNLSLPVLMVQDIRDLLSTSCIYIFLNQNNLNHQYMCLFHKDLIFHQLNIYQS